MIHEVACIVYIRTCSENYSVVYSYIHTYVHIIHKTTYIYIHVYIYSSAPGTNIAHIVHAYYTYTYLRNLMNDYAIDTCGSTAKLLSVGPTTFIIIHVYM